MRHLRNHPHLAVPAEAMALAGAVVKTATGTTHPRRQTASKIQELRKPGTPTSRHSPVARHAACRVPYCTAQEAKDEVVMEEHPSKSPPVASAREEW